MFIPTKTAALDRLNTFLPKAGSEYSAKRNYDYGDTSEASVSMLSPWIRTRQLPEWEVVASVLKIHKAADASKFIDEICWRTYWKGWLELRPGVWDDFVEQRSSLLEAYEGLNTYQTAITGNTGIDCFDAWNHELVNTNYLHNHTRMWYASIWIHTLRLPWQLGADWFLRHLLDGDAASNTLSWRWVAGLHTQGKTYLACQSNIQKYTNGRFLVNKTLAEHPIEMNEPSLPKPRPLNKPVHPSTNLRLGLIATDDDLDALNWIQASFPCQSKALWFSTSEYEALNIQKPVIDFRRSAAMDALPEIRLENESDLLNWIERDGLEGIITAEPVAGLNKSSLKAVEAFLEKKNLPLFTVRHHWDEHFYPYASRGFFAFKKAIPEMIERISKETSQPE